MQLLPPTTRSLLTDDTRLSQSTLLHAPIHDLKYTLWRFPQYSWLVTSCSIHNTHAYYAATASNVSLAWVTSPTMRVVAFGEKLMRRQNWLQSPGFQTLPTVDRNQYFICQLPFVPLQFFCWTVRCIAESKAARNNLSCPVFVFLFLMYLCVCVLVFVYLCIQ